MTGGARGLGRTMALALAEAGADVALAGRTIANLEETTTELAAATGRRIVPFGADARRKRTSTNSPDGRFVVFGRNPEGEGIATVDVKDTGTGEQHVLVTGGGGPSVSPDGRLVAYYCSDAAVQRICVVPLSGGEPTEVISGPRLGGLSWLADSRSILTHDRRTGTVMAVPVDGGPSVELAVPKDATSLAVHPDGKRIGYEAGNSAYELWILQNFLPST